MTTTHYRRNILTSASGTDSVNLPGVPAASIQNAEITEGLGEVVVETVGTGSRLMVTGGVLDGVVVVEWDQEG